MKNKVEKILYYLVTACAMNLIFFLRMIPEYFVHKEAKPQLLTYILCGLIGLLFLVGILSSIVLSIRVTKFSKNSLGCEYRVVELENQTGLQYFTHFSLLFLTAFSIPYTCIILDFVFIVLIHFFLGFIYIKENLYYINPILNIYVGLFISTILNIEDYRYSYGRARILAKLKDEIIKLPIIHNEDGSPVIDETYQYSEKGYIPDWQWMEDYIKSLPYGDRI